MRRVFQASFIGSFLPLPKSLWGLFFHTSRSLLTRLLCCCTPRRKGRGCQTTRAGAGPRYVCGASALRWLLAGSCSSRTQPASSRTVSLSLSLSLSLALSVPLSHAMDLGRLEARMLTCSLVPSAASLATAAATYVLSCCVLPKEPCKKPVACESVQTLPLSRSLLSPSPFSCFPFSFSLSLFLSSFSLSPFLSPQSHPNLFF